MRRLVHINTWIDETQWASVYKYAAKIRVEALYNWMWSCFSYKLRRFNTCCFVSFQRLWDNLCFQPQTINYLPQILDFPWAEDWYPFAETKQVWSCSPTGGYPQAPKRSFTKDMQQWWDTPFLESSIYRIYRTSISSLMWNEKWKPTKGSFMIYGSSTPKLWIYVKNWRMFASLLGSRHMTVNRFGLLKSFSH